MPSSHCTRIVPFNLFGRFYIIIVFLLGVQISQAAIVIDYVTDGDFENLITADGHPNGATPAVNTWGAIEDSDWGTTFEILYRHAGSKAVAFDYYWVRTGLIQSLGQQVVAGKNYEYNFWMAAAVPHASLTQAPTMDFEIWTSPTVGGTYTQAFVVSALPLSNTDGTFDSITGGISSADLSAHIGEFMQIRFTCSAPRSHQMFIDDVAFGETAVTSLPEPSGEASGLTAELVSATQINLQWTDYVGAGQLPEGYLILANNTGFNGAPISTGGTDGVSYANDSDLSDGSAAMNVLPGVGAYNGFAGITADNTYYFQVYAYTNSGASIDYYPTSGVQISVSTSTEYSLDVGESNLARFQSTSVNGSGTSITGPQSWNIPVENGTNWAIIDDYGTWDVTIQTNQTEDIYLEHTLATDGIVSNDSRWLSAGIMTSGAQWLEIAFPYAADIGSAHVYLGKDNSNVINDFEIQYFDGSNWQTDANASITSNTSEFVNIVFSTTRNSDRFRLRTTQSGQVSVKEIAVFAPGHPVGGYPFGTGVTVNLAQERMVTHSSMNANGVDVPKFAVDGVVDRTAALSSLWKSANQNGDTLKINLTSADNATDWPQVGNIIVYHGSSSGDYISAFKMQYDSDGNDTWLDIPGASSSGDTSGKVTFNIASPIKTKNVRFVSQMNGRDFVQEIVVLPPMPSAVNIIDIDDGVTMRPRAVETESRFFDKYHRIINRAADKPIQAFSAETGLSDLSSVDSLSHYQILWIDDTNYFRIMSRSTRECLAVPNFSDADDTILVNETYSAWPNQQWFIESLNGTDHFIRNKWSGKAIDLLGGATAASTRLIQKEKGSAATTTQHWRFEDMGFSQKKGRAGLSHSPLNPHPEWELMTENMGWTYNWTPNFSQNAEPFMPMAARFNQWFNKEFYDWSLNRNYQYWQTKPEPVVLMGYNEPNHPGQAEMSVQEALNYWPILEAAGLPMLSPVDAGGYDNTGTQWVDQFLIGAADLGYQVDYMAIHKYSQITSAAPGDPQPLIDQIVNGYNAYGKPIWLTEFGLIDWENDGQWTEYEMFNYFAEFMHWAEGYDGIAKYAIFDFRDAGWPYATIPDPVDSETRGNYCNRFFTSAQDGTMTALGEFYQAFDGDLTIRTGKTYLIHNHEKGQRIADTNGDSPVDFVDLRESGRQAQWVLLDAGSSRYYIVNLENGKRIRSDDSGTGIQFVNDTVTGDRAMWTLSEAEAGRGWYYINNVNTGKRLQLVQGVSDTYALSNGGTTDEHKWRFIVPLNPEGLSTAPVWASNPYSGNITVGDHYSLTLNASTEVSDANGDTILLNTVAAVPAWLNVSGNGTSVLTLSGIPAAFDLGLNTIVIQADDQTGNTVNTNVEITVNARSGSRYYMPYDGSDPDTLWVWHMDASEEGTGSQQVELLNGSVWNASGGKFGSGLEFKNIDASLNDIAYIHSVNIAGSDSSFTAEAWVKWDNIAPGRAQRIFDKMDASNRGFLLDRWGTGKWYMRLGAGASTYNFTTEIVNGLIQDAWHHIALTWNRDTDTLSLWIDGTVAASIVHTGAVFQDSNQSLAVGNKHDGSGVSEFPGTIDELRISQVARSFASPPVGTPMWSTDTIILSPNAEADTAYSSVSLNISDYVYHSNNETITLSQVGGSWLNMSSNETIFSFSGTPTSADEGLNTILIKATDESGYSMNTQVQITVDASSLPPGYPDNPNADDDGDGRTNLYEYFFGLNPLSSNADLNEPLVDVNGSGFPELEFSRRNDNPNISYFVYISTDLQTWVPGTIGSIAGGDDFELQSSSTDGGVDTLILQYKSRYSDLGGEKVFFRVEAVE